jgi:glycerol-3-phosphate acyltransferase PlsX
MRIAVDAMGGDFAPLEIVKGSVEAARLYPHISKIYLVGREDDLRAELAKYGTIPVSIEIVHASEVVDMGEAPAAAIRRKKDSSIAKAVDMVKAGEADAVFSAGSTGAAVAAATLKLRTLAGVDRPAIAVVIPSQTGPVVLLDAGANADCEPEWLCQFAVMGQAFSQSILKRENPKVGLLSIGGEDSKGNEITKEAFRMLGQSNLNFAGNVESRDLFEGRVDVVVTDGFVGNVVLKTSESVARSIGRWLKEELTRNPLRLAGALMIKKGINTIKERSDPENYGGAPLLGVNGCCIIGHGSSSSVAVRNAIRVSAEWVEREINSQIEEQVKQFVNIS